MREIKFRIWDEEYWNEKNSKKSKVWTPVKDDGYCYVDSEGSIEDMFWNDDDVDDYLWSVGNCFPCTPEGEKEAEEYRGKLIARATIERWIKENDDVELDWSDRKQSKYLIWYDHDLERLIVESYISAQLAEFNVSSRSLAERMLVELEKEFKIYYGIR